MAMGRDWSAKGNESRSACDLVEGRLEVVDWFGQTVSEVLLVEAWIAQTRCSTRKDEAKIERE